MNNYPEYRAPIGLALSGAVLLIVGTAVQDLIPNLSRVGALVVTIGWVAIFVAVILFIISLVRGTFK